MNILKKIFLSLKADYTERGFYISVIMNATHFIGILRGLLNKLLYYKNIHSTVFSLQAHSRIEIFNKKANVYVGKYVFIRKNVSIRIDFDGILEIGEKVFINDNCNINCVGKISIGKNTKIAPNVSINDHDHNYKDVGNKHLIKGEIRIGENVWIGSHVVILRDTVIGDNAVIAAGSIVKGEVPPNTLFLNKREKTYISYNQSNV